jgi:hypothetical protein
MIGEGKNYSFASKEMGASTTIHPDGKRSPGIRPGITKEKSEYYTSIPHNRHSATTIRSR